MGLVTAAGGAVTVGRRLAAGGQGEVFAVIRPRGLVFKRYLPGALDGDPSLERRLRVMLAGRPAGWREPGSGHLTLAWPTEIVLQDGRFCGFLMPVVDMADTVGLHRITNPTDRGGAAGATGWARGFTWRYLVRTAANLARATRALHEAGVVIGDFNESNVRVWRDARVTLLDCDSMQLADPVSGERFFCLVGRPEFTPPELLGADWPTTVRDPSSDLFALAIHLYQLMLEGEHPFRGVWRGAGDKPAVPELAAQGMWALRASGLLAPRPAAIGAGVLPPAITGMFGRVFEDGAVDPGARPAAAEWQGALEVLEGQLRPCPADQAHFYPGGREPCPWCQRRVLAAMVSVTTAAPGSPPPHPLPAPGRPAPARRPTLRMVLATVVTLVLALAAILTLAVTHARFVSAHPGPSPVPGPVRTLTDPVVSEVQAVAFSPDGKTLAAGGGGSTGLWSTATGRLITTLTDPFLRFGLGGKQGQVMVFRPDGKMLAVSDFSGGTFLWSTVTRRLITTLTGPTASVQALTFSPDGYKLAGGDEPDGTFLWSVATGHFVNNPAYPVPGFGVNALAFSPDGKTLAGADGGVYGSIYLWNTATRRLITTTTLTDPGPEAGIPQAVAFSPDGKMLAAGDDQGYTNLWNVATGRLVATLTDPVPYPEVGYVEAVAFSPDGRTLATGDGNDSTYLWNIATRRLITTLTDPAPDGGIVQAVAFSPDGKTLATGDYNGSIYLWNLSPERRKR